MGLHVLVCVCVSTCEGVCTQWVRGLWAWAWTSLLQFCLHRTCLRKLRQLLVFARLAMPFLIHPTAAFFDGRGRRVHPRVYTFAQWIGGAALETREFSWEEVLRSAAGRLKCQRYVKCFALWPDQLLGFHLTRKTVGEETAVPFDIQGGSCLFRGHKLSRRPRIGDPSARPNIALAALSFNSSAP